MTAPFVARHPAPRLGRPTAGRQTVAFVGNQPFALARFRTLLVRDLTTAGHRVVVFSPGWDCDPASRDVLQAAGAETAPIAFDRSKGSLTYEARSVLSIRRALRGLRPDAVFSHFVKPVLYTAVATAGLGIPRRVAMIEGLGVSGGGNGKRRRVLAAAYRVAGTAYDTLFVLNAEDEAYFRDDVGLRADRLRRVEGMGIDLDQFAPAPPPGRPAPTFLYVGRMLEQKGVWDFVEAARRVKAEHPGTRFVMLGGADDSYDAVSEAELRRRTDAAGVEWRGHVDDVEGWLREADVFVLPSFYREGYPRSIMEAMATGRAVITTDNPGCREAVADGVNGLVVPPRDPAALADAMQSLVGRPARVARMGEEGRRLAEERYDYRRINAIVMGALLGEPVREPVAGGVGR
ncbi:glycosyltransferase family 4 protein [Rubrivirga sp. S365]|uniref:Glycosyltransferase family 4 protein n=1 Tax=Rubrivirga litoralis TaxID=3075598 RepID=A0ABU3BRA8_9BACT|nr:MULTISPECIES: glycosyltransferase family 4 protein [unclassified Rubrivirga]MDT0631808.1 glycosyltransferase family 4 protein [Rubrivirga sp. F394]MDT7856500.1 glycosyltransferase family 4 protein [Rubrivirga sp. S365]